LFLYRHPGGDRRADRRSFEPRRFVADGKTESLTSDTCKATSHKALYDFIGGAELSRR
jgi:hypothetical protein